MNDSGSMAVTNSIAVDSRGQIYVQSRFRDGISVFDSEGKYLDLIDVDSKFSWCVKIDAKTDMLYYGSTDNTIKKYDLVNKCLVKTLDLELSIIDKYNNYDGRYNVPTGFDLFIDLIYVVDSFDNSILVVDDNGLILKRFRMIDVVGEDIRPARISVTDNNIIVSFPENNSVFRFNHDMVVQSKICSKGIDPGCFEVPWDVSVIGGCIYVSDLYNHRIQVFDEDFNYLTEYGKYGHKLGEFDYVYSFEVSGDCMICADTWNHGFQIWKLGRDIGRYLPYKKIAKSDVNLLLRPSRLSDYGHNAIVVADYLNHCFKIISVVNGKCIGLIEPSDQTIGEFQYPTGVVRVENILLCADARNGRVLKFDINEHAFTCSVFIAGSYKAPMGPSSDEFLGISCSPCEDNSLKIVTDITADRDGNIFVADIGDKAVFKYNIHGEFVGKIGKGLLSVDNKTSFISCKSYNKILYVTNPGCNTIHSFDANGNTINSYTATNKYEMLNAPTGIDVDDNYIYIADRLNHRIVVLSHDMSFVTAIGKIGNGFAEFCSPWDVLVTDDKLCIADSLNNRIQFLCIGDFL